MLFLSSRLAWLSTCLWITGVTQATGDALDERSSPDPTSFSWVKNWAAVGDSFTAGIGSGNIYDNQESSKSCSRYDYTYPALMNQYFGKTVENFYFVACSGATTQDISTQISNLPSGLDLVVLTAGGNDLCLVCSDMIYDPAAAMAC